MSNLTELQDIKIKLRKEYDQLQIERKAVAQQAADLENDCKDIDAEIKIAVDIHIQAEKNVLKFFAAKELEDLKREAHRVIQGKYDEADQRIKESIEIQKDAKQKNNELIKENNRMIESINKLKEQYTLCNQLVDMANKLKIDISNVSMASFLKVRSTLSPEQLSLYFSIKAPK